MQLAHSGDDRLAGLLVGPDLEGRVLLGETLDRDAQLVLVALGPRLDRDVDDRSREGHRFQDHRLGDIAERVARRGVLQAHDRHDLASDRRRALFALVGVHLVDLADPLLAALDRVEHLRAGGQGAGVDPQVGQLAQVLVGHDLERERGERLGRVGCPQDVDRVRADRVTDHRGDVHRARQEVHDRVEHGLDALVLERGTAQHRGNHAGDRGPPDGGDELLGVGLIALQVQLHHLFVVLGDGLEQVVAPLAGSFDVVDRDLGDLVVLALVLALPEQSAHPDQVDDAAEVGLDAPGQLDDQRHRAEAVVIISTQRWNSAPTRSILLTKQILGTPYRLA